MGGAAGAADLFFAHDVAQRLPLRHVAEALLVSGIFGIVYFGGAIFLWVPEARATLKRFGL